MYFIRIRAMLILCLCTMSLLFTACTKTPTVPTVPTGDPTTEATKQEGNEEATTNPTTPLQRTEFVLGTAATISLYDHQSEELLDLAFDRIRELEDTLSINKSGTLLDEVNAKAGMQPVAVDPDTYELIQQGIHYSQLTDGDFDITVGPLVRLWNIGFPSAKVPTPEEIATKLPLINYTYIQMDEANHSIYLEKAGMQIDLGGIGKGYAADEVAKLLRENGVEHALINLGGNIYTVGDKPGNLLWKIGIQDPFNPRGQTVGYVSVADKSIVTSGVYERYLEEDGVRYHHILNPETGYPFENDIAGVTIISDSSTDGDAISTSVFAKGIAEGITFVESLENIEAIFITHDNELYFTSGIADNFVLTNTDFTIK